ncbi:hypothetical protein EW145_g1063 [Phellinidium pouzarii]|uniref:Transcription factor domain-containing protein n=1 Tax=Phellinidium pouzarii TaxID=167371 RepID=A0A4V6S1B2_9AGAM|nr:hypothetical protein EW145_g1063 [Phellinidium pouzarii]
MDVPVDCPAPKLSAVLFPLPPHSTHYQLPSAKSPVVRGARACTMKCVGAEDGDHPCQRCRRANTEYATILHASLRNIAEGVNPAQSQLSEASKMLRRLEKGLNNAKLKSQAAESALPSIDPRPGSTGDIQVRLLGQSDIPQYRPDLASRRPTLDNQPERAFHPQVSGACSMDEDENDGEPNEEGMYPAKLIKKEKQRNSFFGTVLGPSGSARSPEEHACSSVSPTNADHSTYASVTRQPFLFPPPFGSLDDPIQKGFMDEQTAENIIEMVLIRLNPFINLFDPELHSFTYIRKKCPFLFTTLLMAGKPDDTDELVVESYNWHEQVPAGTSIRPEDVIVSAFVSLRLIATETTKMFELQKGSLGNGQPDNYDFLLNACNSKLSSWSTTWSMEMRRAHGELFHHSFLEFFQLYVGLFLNSFTYMSNATSPSPSLQALGTCYGNALRCLQIVVKEFARVQMLQYSQESVTTMTAYCAVMLLQLLRKANLKTDEGSSANVLALILSTADAYKEAGTMMPSSSSCAAHARFLRILVEREELRARQMSRDRMENIDPTLQPPLKYSPYAAETPPGILNGTHDQPGNQYPYQAYPTSQPLITPQSGKSGGSGPAVDDIYDDSIAHADYLYYDNMCRELGVRQGVDLIQASPNNFYQRIPNSQSYTMMGN